jgi:signal transduction histidine kinase
MRLQREEGRARLEAMTRTRELEQEIVRASEREQMRIGQDLHDGLCQNLAAIDCATECLKTELESSSPRQARTASLVQKMLKEALVEARSLARGIFPVHMDEEGLAAALEALVASTNQLRNVSIQYETKGDIRIADPTAAMHLYRIGQEAVSNAVRHAEAAHIRVNLARDGRVLVMTVADDGRGFTTENISTEGMGLRTMKYRAHLIGALLAVAPIPGGGTLVRCTLPLSHGPAN